MHERSLTHALLRQVVALVRRDSEPEVAGPETVRAVVCQWGPLAGVEPLLMQEAFRDLAPAYLGRDSQAELVLRHVPLTVTCEACDLTWDQLDYDFRCRRCGHGVKVVRGDSLYLAEITLAEITLADKGDHGAWESATSPDSSDKVAPSGTRGDPTP